MDHSLFFRSLHRLRRHFHIGSFSRLVRASRSLRAQGVAPKARIRHRVYSFTVPSASQDTRIEDAANDPAPSHIPISKRTRGLPCFTGFSLAIGRFKHLYDTARHTAYTYKICCFGDRLDIQRNQHIRVRAIDFECQQWLGYTNGLAPQVLIFRAAFY